MSGAWLDGVARSLLGTRPEQDQAGARPAACRQESAEPARIAGDPPVIPELPDPARGTPSLRRHPQLLHAALRRARFRPALPRPAVACDGVSSGVRLSGTARRTSCGRPSARCATKRSSPISKREVRAIADYLDLAWTDAMLEPGRHAASKGFISAPSYSQVVQPVNARAVGRWNSYASHFAPVISHLRPYLDRWGYSA